MRCALVITMHISILNEFTFVDFFFDGFHVSEVIVHSVLFALSLQNMLAMKKYATNCLRGIREAMTGTITCLHLRACEWCG